jgi:hypothetical protein
VENMYDAETSPSSASQDPVGSNQATTQSSTGSPGFADPQVLARRERSIIDGILNNESLTADLDDQDAREMIDWSIAIGKDVARKTAGQDEHQAEKVISECMYANRKLMRSVNRLVVEANDLDEHRYSDLITCIRDQAKAIYGDEALRSAQAGQFLDGRRTSPGETLRVVHVRQALEPAYSRAEKPADR